MSIMDFPEVIWRFIWRKNSGHSIVRTGRRSEEAATRRERRALILHCRRSALCCARADEAGMRIKVKVHMLRDALEKAVKNGTEAGLQRCGETVLEKSRAMVPVDTGRLRDSGKVTVQGLEGCISYDTPYAEVVHENPFAHHPAGQYKFLETVAEDQGLKGTLLAQLGEGLTGALGK